MANTQLQSDETLPRHLSLIFCSTSFGCISLIWLLMSLFYFIHDPVYIVSSSVSLVLCIVCFLYTVICRIIVIAAQDSKKNDEIQTVILVENEMEDVTAGTIWRFMPHVLCIAKWLDKLIRV